MDYYNTSRGQTGAVIQIGTNGQITNVDDFISGSTFDALYNQTGTNFDYINLKSGDAYWIPLSYTYNEAVGTGSIVYKFKMSTLSSPNKKIKEIAMLMGYFSNYGADSDPTYPIFRMTLPCAGVFNEYTFIDIEQLNEDANTITLKRNNNIWNEIISGSEIIKVDGNVVSKDIDYTIDYLTGVLTWINKPLSTSSITATWKVPYIPKDDLLEFTFEYTIEFQA